jgi:hypothetical protein
LGSEMRVRLGSRVCKRVTLRGCVEAWVPFELTERAWVLTLSVKTARGSFPLRYHQVYGEVLLSYLNYWGESHRDLCHWPWRSTEWGNSLLHR